MAKERKPDLGSLDDENVEKRVEEMMEPDKPKETPASKRIEINEVPSAPELPKNGTAIKVTDHADEQEDTPISEEAQGVLAAIEEVNKQLKGSEGEESSEEEIKVIPDEEPDTDNSAETLPDETAEVEDPILDEENTDTPEADTEASEESEPTEQEETTEEAEDDTATEEPKEVLAILEDEETEKAVEDIVEKEGDALLEAEDEKLAEAFEPKRPLFGGRLRSSLGFFWRNKIARTILLIGLLGGLLTAAIVPTSRYFMLNLAGVRSSASLIVIDESTKQPLKNVKVTLAGQTAQSDKEGNVRLDKLKLGATELSIEKRAFAPVTKQLVVGWGSNPLEEIALKPVGSQYVLVFTDQLSGKPIAKVEATSGEASAVSDDQGILKLTVEKEVVEKVEELEIAVKADGYREEELKISVDLKEDQKVELVAARKHIFISKRSGKFDVYKIDADGKNEQVLLAGTGSEREDMVLASHPNDEAVALVSTRDNQRNKDGFLLSTLTVIDVETGSAKAVAISERIQAIDWVGNRLIYVQVAAGTSTTNPKRHRLMSYEYKEQTSKELATSNYFNDVLVAAGKVFYAPSSAYSGGINSSLYKLDPDGNNRQVVLVDEVWSISRSSYEQLNLSLQQQWYEYKLSDTKPVKLSGEPASQSSRIYIDSPDRKRSLWVDTRDGKGVLLSYDISNKKDTVVRTQSGLKNPIRWLNNSTAVFRINSGQETADYVMSLDGGEAVKIRDVTNTDGIDRWYYY